MTDTRLHVIIRHMTMNDIDQVVALDRESFPNPWPRRVYQHEVANGERARMYVMEPGDYAGYSENGHRAPSGWLDSFLARRGQTSPAAPIIGYSGYWHIADESHISTIAIDHEWRGLKLGELLIWMMIRQAFRERAEKVTLEVRVSNQVAQNLYRKYGFVVYGRRKGYYSDNGEDAFNMGVSPLDEAYRQKIIAYGKDLARALRITDHC